MVAVVSPSAICHILPAETPELCTKERDEVTQAQIGEIQMEKSETIQKPDESDESSAEEDSFPMDAAAACKPDKLQSAWEEEGEPLVVCPGEGTTSPPRDGSFRRRYNSAIGNMLHFDGQRLWAKSSPAMQRRVSA